MALYNNCGALLACLIVFLSSLWSPAVAANVPCSPRAGDEGQGQICVCNSTYCDTIERPSRLPKGQYYLYTTSNSTPGFSQTTGTFSAEGVTDDNDVVFTVNSSVLHQHVIGFGGSFTDSVGIVLNTLPEGAQENLMESYFGPTGLEYTLGRVPIGASDFSPSFYTLDDVPYDYELANFSLTQEDFNFKIPYIKRAQNLSTRPLRLYGCAWNSPGWMKVSNVASDYIRREYLHVWAKYHVKFLQAYKDNGVNISAVSGGNEIIAPFTYKGIVGTLMGTLVTAPIQRLWAKEHLGPLLKASNLSYVKLLALDDQRMFAPYWMDRMAADPEAYELTEGVALHWYADWRTAPTILDDLHQNHPDKLIVYTESSINFYLFTGSYVELGSWDRAAAYIYNIIENFNHWTNGYIDWNLALNTDGGPDLGVPLDAAIIVNKTSGEFYKQPIFYGMGHFSKFIPPGSRRVEVKSNQNDTAYVNLEDSSSKMLQMLQNYTPEKKLHINAPPSEPSVDDVSEVPTIKVIVPSVVLCLATANSDDSHTIVVFNSKNVTVRVRVENPAVGSVTLDVEAHSINTFVYWLQ